MTKIKRRKFIVMAIASGVGSLIAHDFSRGSSYAAELKPITLGFIDLMESAPLIVAKEKGFFQKYGLTVKLVRQDAWHTTKTQLQSHGIDGAYILIPSNRAPRGALTLRADFVEQYPQKSKAIALAIQAAQGWCNQNKQEMSRIICQRRWFKAVPPVSPSPKIHFSKVIRVKSDRVAALT